MWQMVIVLSGALTGRLVADRLRRIISLERGGYLIVWATVFFAAYLLQAHFVGGLAELLRLPLFQPWAVAVLMAGTTAALCCWSGLRRRSAATSETRPPVVQRLSAFQRLVGWLLALPVAALHIVLLTESLLRPPRGYDGLFYHLPLIVRWMRQGRLFQFFHEVPEYCHPSNCELWQWLPASTGRENLIEAAMLPLGLLLGLTAFVLAREFGARRLGAWAVALLVLSCPMIAMQTYSSYVDVFGAAFTFGCFLWTLRCFRAGTRREEAVYAVLAGLSGGIALGTKLTNLVWIAGIVVLFVGLRAWRGWRGPRPAHAGVGVVAMGLLFTTGAMVCSVAWYMRNTAHTGWPLYPLQVPMGGVSTGGGFGWQDVQDSIGKQNREHVDWRMFAYPWFEWKRRGSVYSDGNGLGPGFAALAVLGVVYFMLAAARRKQPDLRRAAVGAVVLIGMGAALWAFLFQYNVRYVIPVWCLCFVVSGGLVDLFLRTHRYLGTALVGGVIALAGAMVGAYPAQAMERHFTGGDRSRTRYYGLIPELAALPPGTVILNLASEKDNYPLLGDGLKYEVIESMQVWHGTITLPLTQAQIDRHRIGVVYAPAGQIAPFADGVRHEPLGESGRAYRTFPSLTVGAPVAERDCPAS